jgi:O-antigen/teichoic acid export membrane protein
LRSAAPAPTQARWYGIFDIRMRSLLVAAWAVIDQGLFALSNFGVSILMARWLSPREYGVFTLAYTIFLFLGTVHTGLLVEPMVVFGAGRYRERLPAYLAVLLRGHWILTAMAAGLLAAAAVVVRLFGEPHIGTALLALAAATPFILLLWLVRRGCYIWSEPHVAASGGVLYMALLATGAYLLFKFRWLSSPAAFTLMGIGSLATAACIRWRYPFAVHSERSLLMRRSVFSDHWAYGRWAVGTGLLSGAILHVYYLVMPAWRGLESTAMLRALTNLVMPALQSFLALSVLAVPRLVGIRERAALNRALGKLLVLYSLSGVLYWLALGLLHAPLVRLLYSGRYQSNTNLLWFLGLMPLITALITVFESALRAMTRSDQIFRAYVLSAAVTCIIGLPMMIAWGVGGAIVGMLIALACNLCSMALSYRACARRLVPEV